MPKKTFNRLEEEKQERIMRAAVEEFHTQGFERAKVEVIAQNAAVSKGSMYQYFENKEELFFSTVNWSLEYFMKQIDTNTPMKDMDVFDYFQTGLEYRFDLLKNEKTLVLFSQDILTGKFGNLTAQANQDMWKMGEEYMLELIQVGKRKGTIRTDIEDSLLLDFFQGVTQRMEATIFNEFSLSEAGLEVTEDTYQKINHLLDAMITLLKEGMGC